LLFSKPKSNVSGYFLFFLFCISSKFTPAVRNSSHQNYHQQILPIATGTQENILCFWFSTTIYPPIIRLKLTKTVPPYSVYMYTYLLQLCSGAVDGRGVGGIQRRGGGGERAEICINALMVLGRNFLGRRDSVWWKLGTDSLWWKPGTACVSFISFLFLFLLKKKKKEPQFVNLAT
jgi:hypothetical protein